MQPDCDFQLITFPFINMQMTPYCTEEYVLQHAFCLCQGHQRTNQGAEGVTRGSGAARAAASQPPARLWSASGQVADHRTAAAAGSGGKGGDGAPPPQVIFPSTSRNSPAGYDMTQLRTTKRLLSASGGHLANPTAPLIRSAAHLPQVGQSPVAGSAQSAATLQPGQQQQQEALHAVQQRPAAAATAPPLTTPVYANLIPAYIIPHPQHAPGDSAGAASAPSPVAPAAFIMSPVQPMVQPQETAVAAAAATPMLPLHSPLHFSSIVPAPSAAAPQPSAMVLQALSGVGTGVHHRHHQPHHHHHHSITSSVSPSTTMRPALTVTNPAATGMFGGVRHHGQVSSKVH